LKLALPKQAQESRTPGNSDCQEFTGVHVNSLHPRNALIEPTGNIARDFITALERLEATKMLCGSTRGRSYWV